MERCRVCLEASESKMYPLEGSIVNCDVSISEMITYCTSIEIDSNDGWPTSVCVPCFRTVRISYNFIREFKERYEGSSLAGTIQPQATHGEIALKHETGSINDDQDERLEERDQINLVEECEREEIFYEYEQELSDENELEAEDVKDSGSVQKDDIYHNNDINFHQVLVEDVVQDDNENSEQRNENAEILQENIDSTMEEFIFSKQDLEECEIEYEVLDSGNTNDALQDTLGEDVVYELTNTPEQRIIKVINKQGPSDKKQSTKLRRKIKTRISCPLCLNVFFSSYDRELVPHMMSHVEQAFPCNVCNTDLVYNPETFLNHFHQIHRYQCPFCAKSFTRKQNLNTHIKGHSGITYVCSFQGCNKTFPAAWNLKKHQTTHSGKITHICPECGMEFKTYDTYRYHRKKHSGRKFLCTHCGQAFMQSVHLKYHMWTHTGIKHFKCDLCEKSYTSVTQLKKHRRRHHPKAKEFNKYEEIVEEM